MKYMRVEPPVCGPPVSSSYMSARDIAPRAHLGLTLVQGADLDRLKISSVKILWFCFLTNSASTKSCLRSSDVATSMCVKKACIDLLYLRHVYNLITVVIDGLMGIGRLFQFCQAATGANFNTRLQQWPTDEL
jgi:hypothetical protein